MPLFTYTATNDDNNEVRGSIESTDEQNARKALEDLSLDVLEISEASRSHESPAAVSTEPQMPVFAFEGKDASGSVRRGTMQAPSKYEAFKKLRDDQKLFLMMLSPIGTLPQYKDTELDQWQRGVKDIAVPVANMQTQSAVAAVPRPAITFTNIPEPKQKSAKATATTPITSEQYHPLTATLRLYAGWLLAWYGLFVAVGYYSVMRTLPWDIPFVQAFYLSSLIFSFIIAIFIFLLFSAIHKAMKGGLISGIAFSIAGIALFVGVRMIA